MGQDLLGFRRGRGDLADPLPRLGAHAARGARVALDGGAERDAQQASVARAAAAASVARAAAAATVTIRSGSRCGCSRGSSRSSSGR